MSYLSKLTKRLAAAFALWMVAVSCQPDATILVDDGLPNVPEIEIGAVRVLPDTLDVRVGAVRRLVAEARDVGGRLVSSETVTWTSDDSSVVSVDSTGTVTARREGSTQVRARVRGVIGRSSMRITVEPVASVQVTPSQVTMRRGEAVDLDAMPRSAADSTMPDRPVTWRSSAPTVATVDTVGLVRALAAGSAVITAESEGRTGQASLTVEEPAPGVPGTVGGLTVTSISDTTATLRFTEVSDGTGAAANYEIRYATPSITWASATPVARGTCTSPLAGTTAGQVRTCSILGLTPSTAYQFQVRAFRGTLGVDAVHGGTSNVASATTAAIAVASVTLTPSTAALITGQTTTLTPTALDAGGNPIAGRTFSWTTTASAVATVSSAGVVTAVGPGSATIRATTGGRTGSASVTVTAPAPAPVATVTVAPASDTVLVGATRTFTATLLDSAGATLTGRSISWTSTNTGVATVSASGVVTGVASGTATIRATSEGRIGSGTITVTAPLPAAVATVTLSPTSASIQTGQTTQFAATARDALGNTLTGRTTTWTSTNTSVATVSSTGVVTAVAVGSATVRATVEGIVASASVTVSAPPVPGANHLFYNSAEPGCNGSDPNILFCDDFEDGDWYILDGDRSGSNRLQNDGWIGTIWANPITPAGAAVCGRGAAGTNCAATTGVLDGVRTDRNMAMHPFAGGPVTELWARWYYYTEPGYEWGAEKNANFTKQAGDIAWFNIQFNCGTGSRRSTAIPEIQIIHGTQICQQPNVNPITLQSGRWYYFEVHLRLNSSGTTADGLIEMWINDCGTTGVCTGTPTLRTRMQNVRFNRNQSGCQTSPCQVEVIWFEAWANPASRGTGYFDQIIASKAGPIGFMRP